MANSAIAMEDALKITRLDAETVYRNLSRFRVSINLREDGWHIAFEIQSKFTHGGGPHYLIDSAHGDILWKRYYQ